MNTATTPGVRYIPSATKVPTAENYLSIDDINYTTINCQIWTKTLTRDMVLK
jgi:hypothetical protein